MLPYITWWILVVWCHPFPPMTHHHSSQSCFLCFASKFKVVYSWRLAGIIEFAWFCLQITRHTILEMSDILLQEVGLLMLSDKRTILTGKDVIHRQIPAYSARSGKKLDDTGPTFHTEAYEMVTCLTEKGCEYIAVQLGTMMLFIIIFFIVQSKRWVWSGRGTLQTKDLIVCLICIWAFVKLL